MRFNPRARVGRDLKKMAEQGKLTTVSIHAPVWGATGIRPADHGRCIVVSIHAPVWGATLRLPAGVQVAHVSIHAPVWGATTVGARPGQTR